MLIEFYGEECPHCAKIAPFLARLEKESGVKIERKEVWHNEANMNEMREKDTAMCGGVPFLINTETGASICGEADYDTLKKWAGGGDVKAVVHSPAQTNLDFNYIADGIYIGTNQCCRTHFDEQLKGEGIQADMSLEENMVDMPFGVDFYTWIPVKNQMAPTKDQLEFGVAVLDHLVRAKKKIYVHCKNGHGRAPTLVAAYFMKKGKTVDEAIGLIKKSRTQVHLNDMQLNALKQYAKSLV